MQFYDSSGLCRTAMSRCGVWTHQLAAMGTVEACTDRKWDRQAQAGRKNSTVTDGLQTLLCNVYGRTPNRPMTARLNNSLSKFIQKGDGEA